jgi:hypothetical protein|tara:strand:- start:1715 stop:1912 length:198 start_codon:yes stop_codon:yes gene_type:complete
MNKILIVLMSLILVSCSNITNPKLSFGKKCIEKGNEVVYSYVWIYDKTAGLQADNITCEAIANQD